MKKGVSVTLWIAVLVVALVLSTFGAHAQREEKTERGIIGLARMLCNIEGLWAEVAFTAKAADAKLLKMRPDFQKAWDARNEVGAGMTLPEDMASSFEKTDKIFSELLDTVKKGLTEEELGRLSEWLEQQKLTVEMMREGLLSAAGAVVGAERPQEE